MWCNKTCVKSTHIWKGAKNMRDVPSEPVAHGKIIPAGRVLYSTFPGGFLDLLMQSLFNFSLSSRWSSLLALVRMKLLVLGKIRFYFCTLDMLSLQEMKSSQRPQSSSWFSVPLFLLWPTATIVICLPPAGRLSIKCHRRAKNKSLCSGKAACDSDWLINCPRQRLWRGNVEHVFLFRQKSFNSCNKHWTLFQARRGI